MFSISRISIFLFIVAILFSCNKEEEETKLINETPNELIQWFIDSDQDGFGNPDPNLGKLAITKPSGFVKDNSDCNDSEININPDAEEDPYDGIDSNCDGTEEQIVNSLSLNFGGASADYAARVFQKNSGNYIIGGSSVNDEMVNFMGGFDYYLLEIDSDGQKIWEKRYGGPGRDFVEDISQTSDGGYIMCGRSDSEEGNVRINFGSQDWWVVKLDSEGNIIWEISIGGNGDDVAHSIIEANDNGYLIAGSSSSTNEYFDANKGGEDSWLVKLDTEGNLMWKANYGGSGSDNINTIIELDNGDILANGTTTSTDGDVMDKTTSSQDLWILRLSPVGSILWVKTFGGSDYDIGQDMVLSPNNDLVIAGASFSSDGDIATNQGKRDAWIVNISENGTINWSKTFGSSFEDFLFSINIDSDGNYLATGSYAWDNNSDGDLWVLKLDNLGSLVWENKFGGTEFDQGADVKAIGNDGIIVLGQSSSINGDITGNLGDVDIWLLKLKPNGKL